MASWTRAAYLVLGLLVAAGVALALLAAEGPGVRPALLALGLVVPPAGFALLAALWLRRLRHDFDALAEFVRDGDAARPPLRTREAAPLFHASAELRARALAMEALEHEASAALAAAEQLRVGFVASMGHDLRAPLNAIVGFADLLAMDETIDTSQRQSVEIVRRSAQDLLVLLDQILDWARLETGRIVLAAEQHSPAELIAKAIEEATRRSADRGLAVQSEVPRDLPPVEVDGERFVEALLGLLDHASRTANAPGIVVRARQSAPGSESPALCVEVHDPALRIRTADQQRFFEPFRASYAPSGQRIAGLGLGPALARALIRAHGGEVWFASDASQGTTFHLRLPLAEASPGNPQRSGGGCSTDRATQATT